MLQSRGHVRLCWRGARKEAAIVGCAPTERSTDRLHGLFAVDELVLVTWFLEGDLVRVVVTATAPDSQSLKSTGCFGRTFSGNLLPRISQLTLGK